MNLQEPVSLIFALIIETILSFYYLLFIMKPLVSIEKKTKKYHYCYFIIMVRIIIVAFLDFFSPTIAIFLDFLLLFLLSFTIVKDLKSVYNFIKNHNENKNMIIDK